MYAAMSMLVFPSNSPCVGIFAALFVQAVSGEYRGGDLESVR